jgi:hypothetical protein
LDRFLVYDGLNLQHVVIVNQPESSNIRKALKNSLTTSTAITRGEVLGLPVILSYPVISAKRHLSTLIALKKKTI